MHRRQKFPWLLLLLLAIAGGAMFHAYMASSTLVAQYIPPVHRTMPPRVKVPHRASQPVLRLYTVQPGDTLTDIAQAHCPRAGDWVNLAKANHITGFLQPGEIITLACN